MPRKFYALIRLPFVLELRNRRLIRKYWKNSMAGRINIITTFKTNIRAHDERRNIFNYLGGFRGRGRGGHRQLRAYETHSSRGRCDVAYRDPGTRARNQLEHQTACRRRPHASCRRAYYFAPLKENR